MRLSTEAFFSFKRLEACTSLRRWSSLVTAADKSEMAVAIFGIAVSAAKSAVSIVRYFLTIARDTE